MARINLAQSARQAPSASAVITVGNLTKRFSAPGGGDKFTVIDAVSLTVAEGEFVSIVGPSGCGKSTLLNIIAGIEPYDGGAVTISPPAGKAGVEPHIGYVFQSPRLLNWLTVEQNIEFVLEAQGVARPQWRQRVTEYLEMVGLAGQQRNYPLKLSGGMQSAGSDCPRARHRTRHPADGRALQPSRCYHRTEDAVRSRGDFGKGEADDPVCDHDLSEAVFLSDHIYMMSTKPARIFRHVPVGIPRPRQPEDAMIFDLEKALVREFFSVVAETG